MVLSLPFAANGVDEIRDVETETLGFHDEAINLIGELIGAGGAASGAGGWLPRGHGGADARTHFEQPTLDERRHHLLRGVRVDLQLLTERADGREAVAGSELPGDDRFGDGEDHLVV